MYSIKFKNRVLYLQNDNHVVKLKKYKDIPYTIVSKKYPYGAFAEKHQQMYNKSYYLVYIVNMKTLNIINSFTEFLLERFEFHPNGFELLISDNMCFDFKMNTLNFSGVSKNSMIFHNKLLYNPETKTIKKYNHKKESFGKEIFIDYDLQDNTKIIDIHPFNLCAVIQEPNSNFIVNPNTKDRVSIEASSNTYVFSSSFQYLVRKDINRKLVKIINPFYSQYMKKNMIRLLM